MVYLSLAFNITSRLSNRKSRLMNF